MNDALEVLRQELGTTPRDNEVITLDTAGWSDDDKRQALALLIDAARRGDRRAPAAFALVATGTALENALTDVMQNADPAVAIEAAWELQTLTGGKLYASVRRDLGTGRLTGSALERALALLLRQGEGAGVMALLDATADEATRTSILDALWRHARLDLFPTPGWAGLGAFRRALLLPIPSFRAPRIEPFKRLLMTNPVVEGFPVRAWELPSAELRAAIKDVDRGTGPTPNGANLTEEEQFALLLHATEQAVQFAKPRALATAALLGGNSHRDLLEWACHHPQEPMRTAAEAALKDLDNPA